MSNNWTDAELAASVEAYRSMAAKDAAKEPYKKAKVYRDLAAQFGRKSGAFARRMQNISALYEELGLPWIPGLKPADHIGDTVKPKLLELIQHSPSEAVAKNKFKHGEKRTWELLLEALTALDGSAGRLQVRNWLRNHYPDYNEHNLVDLEMLSVNSESRTSYSQNSKPRATNTNCMYDALYKVGNGTSARFEPYSPQVHGVWEIYPDPNAGNRYGMSIRWVIDPTVIGLEKAADIAESNNTFNPLNIEDARDRVLTEIVRRRGQSSFRKALLQAYSNTCAMTGSKLVPILEAAHVHPYKGQHTNIVSNGLLLRADIHTLFDLNHIAIDSSTMTILISPDLHDTEYAELKGKKVYIPKLQIERISADTLDWHRSLCGW